MARAAVKRTVDMQIITDWVEPRSRVLDLGCGRGVLLEALVQSKEIQGVGVDLDFDKISACVRRGITAYQGDMSAFMRAFPDGHFDRVICSRTLEEVPNPGEIIAEALRVGKALTVGFVNHAFWKNRLTTFLHGRKPRNEVYTTEWYESHPTNPVSIADFEHFCALRGLRIVRRTHLRGDWKTPAGLLPNLLAGYALYDLAGGSKA
jgi:methionine biosynthesis protein MetW